VFSCKSPMGKVKSFTQAAKAAMDGASQSPMGKVKVFGFT